MYYQDSFIKIYNRDSREMELEDNSVDLIVTDPPYGYSFMGKNWDKAVIPVGIWKECLRVLKPGAFAFVMCSPRQDCLGKMICNLSDAGFETGFTSLYWAYASGFPKAQNIGKAVDKKLGFREDEAKGFSRAGDYGGRNLVDKPIPFKDYKRQDYLSPQAKALDGSYGGFQPKPAVEIILVVMKPLAEKTFVDQALKNRKGISWLDDGRIPYESHDSVIAKNPHTRTKGSDAYDNVCYGKYNPKEEFIDYTNQQGRFPANLLISDDVLNDGREQKSGKAIRRNSGGKNIFSEQSKPQMEDMGYGDNGSFSRYFDLDKWAQKTFPFLIVPKASRGEKNKDVGKAEIDIGHNRFDKCAECGGYILQNPDRPSACRCANPVREHNKVKGNYHPTVKPLKLMSYLITLGSREGDTILDPFVGSGTTCLAAKLLNRKSVGYELKEQYCEIAKARCRQYILEF